VHPEDREHVKQTRETAIRDNLDYLVEYRFTKKDGEIRYARTTGKLHKDFQGVPRFMFGSIQDVTRQKEDEKVLKHSLAEKESMLLEIHHRVKNNLQVILGLLDMTSRRSKSREAAEVIKEVHAKINSMALIHNELYREENLESIDMRGFTLMLFNQLARLYESPGVDFRLKGEAVRLSLERAVPFGLVLNELLTNAFKYAFPEGRGILECDMRQDKGMVTVVISDSGGGLPEDVDPYSTSTLGFKLVRDLVAMQLNGEFKIKSGGNLKVILHFPSK
jgi:two-component sensor histidine kinase